MHTPIYYTFVFFRAVGQKADLKDQDDSESQPGTASLRAHTSQETDSDCGAAPASRCASVLQICDLACIFSNTGHALAAKGAA